MLGKNLQDILFKLEVFLQYGNRITRNIKIIENHWTKHQVNQSVKFLLCRKIIKNYEIRLITFN